MFIANLLIEKNRGTKTRGWASAPLLPRAWAACGHLHFGAGARCWQVKVSQTDSRRTSEGHVAALMTCSYEMKFWMRLEAVFNESFKTAHHPLTGHGRQMIVTRAVWHLNDWTPLLELHWPTRTCLRPSWRLDQSRNWTCWTCWRLFVMGMGSNLSSARGTARGWVWHQDRILNNFAVTFFRHNWVVVPLGNGINGRLTFWWSV